MSGGSRYWNEDTQRWEDTESHGAAPATPPPPTRPDFLPEALPLPSGPPEAPTAPPPGPPTVDGAGAGAGEWPSVTPPAEAPTVSAPGGWPGAGAQDVWPPPATWEPETDGGGLSGHFAEEPNLSWPPAGPPTRPPTGASTEQPAGPFGAEGRRRRLMWSALIGAAVVAVAVSLVLTFVVGTKDPGKDNDSRTTAAHESTRSTPSTQPPTPVTSEPTDVTASPTGTTAPPSAPASEPPVGYTLSEDAEGFRIALPERWTRTTADSSYGIRVVNYHSPDRTHRVQVYQVSEPSPAESFQLYLSGATAKAPGFSKLRLQTLDDGTFTGTRLEYLADSIRGETDLGTWHVYDERFVASDGKIYAIAAYGPDADGRDDELELLTTALDWFCPPLGACDPPVPQDSTPQNP
ncbi:hypothetical protein ACOT81_29870 [Streptomyces sp. WI04-05B]|uniref:hypothetical protein n=1 Tax=Streptomyces TaxID=1883 RepID=UPI0029AB3D91|nr:MULTISPECIES: hypothetical protein [unclassified Streptomyces]MDX2543958.1 hypothetical protein [Streptomyces sp. WI04-05B]MDX2584332.1 hypothetical protein [Streptomyces sp. WI04-05A]